MSRRASELRSSTPSRWLDLLACTALLVPSSLAGCTEIGEVPPNTAESIQLDDVWTASGVPCGADRLHVLWTLKQNGPRLTAATVASNACLEDGQEVWSVVLPSEQIRPADLPLRLEAAVTLAVRSDGLEQVSGSVTLVSRERMIVSTPDATFDVIRRADPIEATPTGPTELGESEPKSAGSGGAGVAANGAVGRSQGPDATPPDGQVPPMSGAPNDNRAQAGDSASPAPAADGGAGASGGAAPVPSSTAGGGGASAAGQGTSTPTTGGTGGTDAATSGPSGDAMVDAGSGLTEWFCTMTFDSCSCHLVKPGGIPSRCASTPECCYFQYKEDGEHSCICSPTSSILCADRDGYMRVSSCPPLDSEW